MAKVDYATRVRGQIEQYAECEAMHDLPAIYDYWAQRFRADKFQAIFGVSNHLEFYAKHLRESAEKTGNRTFVSLGAGDGEIEVEIARRLEGDFEFHLLELSPLQLDRARRNAQDAGLTEHFRFFEADLNEWTPSRRYGAVMAHHTLHHIQNLEGLFDGVRECLDGAFCTMDMVGRNGHMRWPETLEIVEGLWQIIPPEKRVSAFRGYQETYYNHDCSTDGFEGIRAQDILPLLMERFGFEAFFAFGGLVDVFVGRDFGHNYDPDVEWDRAFIDFVARLNETLIDCGHIKPTEAYAVMGTEKVTPRIYGRRSPHFCTRPC